MPTSNPFSRDKLENWVSDFCISDHLRPFTPQIQELAPSFLLTFLQAACDHRRVEPEDLEEADVRAAILGPLSQLAIPANLHWEVPQVCGTFLAYLQSEGRLAGGNALGTFAKALTKAFVDQASPVTKPITRPGTKIGRNDPCPCGSGKKYKKCCANE